MANLLLQITDTILDGKGIAVHFSFNAQKEGMEKTDLLDRYRAYAEENVC